MLFRCAIVLIWAAAGLRAQSEEQVREAARGTELMAQHKFEEAVPIWRQLSREVPGNPGLLLNLGMALHLAGHSRQAIPPLESALKQDPAMTPAWLFLGASYVDTGMPAKAVQWLKKFVAAEPAHAGGHETLAEALLAMNAFADALPEYRKLSELEPGNRRAWYGLNRCYTALAQGALYAIEKSAPESAWWLALVADERVVRRQFRSAFFFYRQAEAKKPDLPGLHASIAAIYQQTGHPDWAESERARERPLADCAGAPLACAFRQGQYGEVIRGASASTDPEACYWRARAMSQLARDASERLEKLPEGPEIHELRAIALRARRQNLEAIKEWRLALKYAPKDEHLNEELLSSLYQARDYAAALPLADQLLRQNPNSAALNFTKGDILLSSQEAEKAIPFLKSALRLNPDLLAAHDALGRAYMETGQPSAAIAQLKAALPADEDGSVRYQLARAYQATAQEELAKKTMQEYQQRQQADRIEKTALEEELKITPP